jgi:O-antigen ligase
MIRSPASQQLHRTIPLILAAIAVTAYIIGVVALFASGRFFIVQAGVLLAIPAVMAVALLRPEWTLLLLLVVPPFVISVIPPMQLVAVLAATIFGCFLQGGVTLGPKTGIYPLLGIIAFAFVMQADVSDEAALIADGLLKTLVYYTLLMLASFFAVTNRRLSVDAFVSVCLVGLVVAAILEPFFGEAQGVWGGITQTPYRGKFAYLAAMGFGLAYMRLATSRSPPRARVDAFLAILFLGLAAIGFTRAAWIAVLWAFALASIWTGKKAFWIAASVAFAIVLTVPVVGERVLPGGVTDLTDPQTLDVVTTGRSDLWSELWARGSEALPFGRGWGYIPSLDSMDIFGFEGVFQAGEGTYVHPHNDFLYLFVDLGVVGTGLLVLFWLSLFLRFWSLSHSVSPESRADVRMVAPIIITMFVVQLFDNGFAIRFVATPFFIAAGLVAGLYILDRERSRDAGWSRISSYHASVAST